MKGMAISNGGALQLGIHNLNSSTRSTVNALVPGHKIVLTPLRDQLLESDGRPKRGLIEATPFTAEASLIICSPRSNERGPIEADLEPVPALKVGRFFRALTSAAPLKPSGT